VDEFIRDRASQGLAHVFTLLSLVQPAEPLQIAYHGLFTADEKLRGTALEYLETTLPPLVRTRLWPFLEDRRGPNRTVRPRDEILNDLIRSHPSIRLNLEELKHARRHEAMAQDVRVVALASRRRWASARAAERRACLRSSSPSRSSALALLRHHRWPLALGLFMDVVMAPLTWGPG
jgi:hypothetical protein